MQQQLIGHQLNEHYRITEILGQQSGRRTFLAETADQSLVVIKLVLFGPDFEWVDLKLFEREAETLRSLDHPAIPKYLDSFEVDTPLGKGFALVQTYIEAKSLAEWVSEGNTFGEDELCAIARKLLHILECLHQRHPPVIHRDIKPSNILLNRSDSYNHTDVYLVDFGSVQIAPSAGTMTVVGTYGYMPMEQFGGRAQPASDLYSLGATLLYLATGQHPSEFTQGNLQLAFEDEVLLSPQFIHWMKQLTYTDITKRIPSAKRALYQLEQQELEQSPSLVMPVTQVQDDLVWLPPQSVPPSRMNRRDFHIVSTPEKLKIKFPNNRLGHYFGPTSYSAASWLNTSWIKGIEIVFTAFLMMGLYLWEEQLIVWMFSAGIFLAISWVIWSVVSPAKTTILKLTPTATNQIQLNLSEMGERSDEKNSLFSRLSSQKALATLEGSLKFVSANTSGLYCSICFHYLSSQERTALTIWGNYHEIKWLCEHITFWADIDIYYDEPSVSSLWESTGGSL
ncbi:MAG: serine/threonine-protein kinase [Cyanobacteria bacterium J06627_28]